MTQRENVKFVRHLRKESYDIGVFWKNLEACTERGICIQDDETNQLIFYPYSYLYAKAGECAQQLVMRGLQKNDILLLSAATNIRVVITWLACIRLGVIPATLPPRIAFFSEDAYKRRIRDLITYFRHFVCFGNEVPLIEAVCREKNAAPNLHIIHQIFSEMRGDNAVNLENNSPGLDDPAFIQFSSGSSGVPKGIIITFKNILSNICFIYDTLDLDPETSSAGNWLPLYHDMGLVGFLLATLFTQTNLILVSPVFFMKRMFDFMRMIHTCRISYTCMTNSMMDIMLLRYNEQRFAGLRLDTLKWIGVGSEPVNIATVEKFQSVFKNYGLKDNVISPCYGLAESTLVVSMSRPFEKYDTNMRGGYTFPTVGRIYKETQVEFRNDGTMRGNEGIIHIKGDSVVDYSLVNGEKVKLTDNRGFYNTNDIGYLLDGKLVVIGRCDTMFIVGGENFFPHEVEAVIIDSQLLPRPSAVCLSLPPSISQMQRTELIILYEVNKITPAEKNELEEKLAKIIIRHTGLRIDKFIAVKRGCILYTTSGKIQYNAMRELYLKGEILDYFAT